MGNTLFYTGHEFDAATGLYYMRARYYDPALGRFMSRDPIGYLGGINLYEYCGDRPINNTDPSGSTTVMNGNYWDLGSSGPMKWLFGVNMAQMEMMAASDDGCTLVSYQMTGWAWRATGWTMVASGNGPFLITKTNPKCHCGKMECATGSITVTWVGHYLKLPISIILTTNLSTTVRRLDSTVRFRIVFHGCLAEEVSSWLSGYPALNPALYPALYLQIEPRPSKCHHASWTNNLKRLGRFSAKNLKTSGQIFLALAHRMCRWHLRYKKHHKHGAEHVELGDGFDTRYPLPAR